MIFVKKITRPEVLGPKFYPKKRVNRDKSKFATKQRKSYKMQNLEHQKTQMLQNNGKHITIDTFSINETTSYIHCI